MSADADTGDVPPTTGPDAVDYEGFDHLRIEDDLLVYDVDDENAWVQSDVFVPLAERC